MQKRKTLTLTAAILIAVGFGIYLFNAENKMKTENNFENLTGKKFGKLTAIKMIRKADSQGQTREFWECKCDCGNTNIVLKNHLMKNQVISCGCVVKERQNRI